MRPLPALATLVTTSLAVASAALASFAVAQEVPAHTSVGTAQRGRIAGGGVALPLSGPGFHWRSNRQNREARYGTPALVGALERAAARVAERFEGSDLEIEDLSFERGGRIRGHGSHTSGRDADVGYYAVRADGTRVNPTVSRWFRRNGQARGHPDEAFDVERNWLLLETLLSDEAIDVQYIFMYPAHQRRLLDHAGEAGAAFEAVVRTPRGRNMDPHADHFHVRIHCPAADVAHGCVDGRRAR